MSQEDLVSVGVVVTLVDRRHKLMLVNLVGEGRDVRYTFPQLRRRESVEITQHLTEFAEANPMPTRQSVGSSVYELMANAVHYHITERSKMPNECRIVGRETSHSTTIGAIMGYFDVSRENLSKPKHPDLCWVNDVYGILPASKIDEDFCGFLTNALNG